VGANSNTWLEKESTGKVSETAFSRERKEKRASAMSSSEKRLFLHHWQLGEKNRGSAGEKKEGKGMTTGSEMMKGKPLSSFPTMRGVHLIHVKRKEMPLGGRLGEGRTLTRGLCFIGKTYSRWSQRGGVREKRGAW